MSASSILCPETYRITRSSPARRVTRSRSRYSSRGMAYFRVIPVSSLKAGTEIRSPLDFGARFQGTNRDHPEVRHPQSGAEGFSSHTLSQAGAQVFPEHSRQERILFLKFLDLLLNLVANLCKDCFRNQHERFRGN